MNEQADVVDAIWEHWVLHRSIDVQEANVMRDELATHLTEAKEHGSSTRDVVGPDIRKFADDWADPAAERTVRAQVRDGFQVVVAAVCGVSFAAVVANWSFDLSVHVFAAALNIALLSLGASFLFSKRASRLRAHHVIRPSAQSVTVGLASGLMIVGWVWLDPFSETGPEVTLPRIPLMALASAGAFFLLAMPLGPRAIGTLRKAMLD